MNIKYYIMSCIIEMNITSLADINITFVKEEDSHHGECMDPRYMNTSFYSLMDVSHN